PLSLHQPLHDVELETDLRKTTKRLKEALAVKSEFISTLSHEIRTPLNSIIGHTQLLQESRLDRTQKQHVRRLEQSSRLLMDLLNGILDLSRIESGRYTVSPKVFILDDLIDKVLGSFMPAAQEKNIHLHYDRGPDVPFRIESDPLCFEQILMNLLSNAIKFTADGTVVLSLRFTEESPGRFRLTVAVSDTGIGFDRTVTDRLFEPFSQADASIRRMFGGSGLGLAISSRLVSLLGGILHAESSPQEGSTFSFSLYPALPDSAFDYPYPQEVNILPKAVQLVCSDDTYTESLLSFHLTRMGFTVDTGTGLTHPVHGTDCLLVVQEDIYRLYISSPSIFRSAPPEYIILIQNGSTRTHAITAGIPLLGLPVSPQELSDILREMEDTGKHYLQESYKVSVPDSAGARCIDEEMESVKCLRQLHFNLRQDIGKAHDNLDRLIELSDEDGRKDLARIRELLSRFRIRETAAAVEEFAQKHKIYLKDI
ncbi:MAG: sensor histidine kinase, partial [Spirochaetota bacterium]